MVILFRPRLRGAALLATLLAISPPSHADEPIEPQPEGLATTFEQFTRFAAAADPKSPFQQIQLTAVLDEAKATPALPSKSAPDKVPPAAQAPVMDAPRPIEYHYHYHAPAISSPAQSPVMAAPQQQAAVQQPVLVAAPTVLQAVQTTQQLPAVEHHPGPIRRMVGNAAYALSHIDDVRYVSRVPRTRPAASTSTGTAVHTVTTTTTQPAVAPVQSPVFAAPPAPFASAQR